MTFRIEEKIDINKDNLFHLLKWVKKNNGKKIYDDRKIQSIYFDNRNFDMYQDSQEGLLPRKKLRIRSYNNVDSKFLFETKISSTEGRFKVSKKILNFKSILKKGIFDKKYGYCNPVICVEYNRSYFSVLNYRLTIDNNISYSYYSKLKSKISKMELNIIAEIKNKSNNFDAQLIEKFPFTRIRFSKYCRGMQLIYGLK
jgi:hypothetical protein